MGRVTADKGVAELLLAWRDFVSVYPDSRLVIAGMLEVDATRGNLAALLNSSENVLVLNHVDDLSVVYSSLDVMVLPSYREGLPTVVLEAGSYEVPCVVSDTTGTAEAVVHGATGIVIPSREPSAVLSALCQIRQDPAAARRMGQDAKRHIATRYGQSMVHASWLEVIEQSV